MVPVASCPTRVNIIQPLGPEAAGAVSPPKPSGFGARSNGAGVGNLKKKGLVAVHLNQPGSTRSVAAQGAPGMQGTPVPG